MFSIASRSDNSLAIGNKAVCYATGCGVEINSAEAIALFERSIELGNSQSMVNLAIYYLDGEEKTLPTIQNAFRLFEKSSFSW